MIRFFFISLITFLILTGCIKNHNPNYLQGQWQVVKVKLDGATDMVTPDHNLRFSFDADSTGEFNTDHNDCHFKYSTGDEGEISLNTVFCTMVGGDSKVSRAMAEHLEEVDHYHISLERLYLKNGNEKLIVLHRNVY